MKVPCNPLERVCVYNIENDPCEMKDISLTYPNLTSFLLRKLEEFNSTAIPPGNLPVDPCGFPKYWGGVWTNFGDYINKTIREQCQNNNFKAF